MTKTCFSGDLGSIHPRAAAAVGMKRKALRCAAVTVQKLKLISVSLGWIGLLADQQLGFGHRSACNRGDLSTVINLVLAWNVCR